MNINATLGRRGACCQEWQKVDRRKLYVSSLGRLVLNIAMTIVYGSQGLRHCGMPDLQVSKRYAVADQCGDHLPAGGRPREADHHLCF